MNNYLFLALLFLSSLASAETPLNLTLSINGTARNEIIHINVKNKSTAAVFFKSISLERLNDKKWELVSYDTACPCLSKCNSVGTSLDPDKALSLAFDFGKLGCGQIVKGMQYRAIAKGGWDAEKNTSTVLGESQAFIAKE